MFFKTTCSRASAAAPRNILVGRTLTRNVLHPTTQTPFIGAVSYYSSVNEAALAERIERVLEAKRASGLTYDELAQKLSLTNTYTAQLLLGQAKLTSDKATKLQQALPGISDDDLQDMQRFFPMRSFNEDLKKEPNVYRTYEAIMHNGEAIKAIINEQCGDGIMSAIDFYLDVGTTTGKHGEKRVVITFNGKFLSFIEQSLEDNGARSPRD
ncbi:cyanate lyase [Nitzschia inconspicua]|uniref:Cyanate hydratase n=1 Tax=Nitzschia inconspicua TaxID=303405 RepID=A0A9K3Q051_9STRA|nr:cyanate lyase [Nitzschia inconspicua]